MIRHAGRGVPWALLGVSAVLVAVLLRVVEAWPYTAWPLQGIAVGLVAATAAWCFDEPLAAIVDTVPRSLAWRTASRSLGVAALLVAWLAAVLWTREAYFDHAWEVAWQGVAGALATTAFVTWRRGRGAAVPARGVAAVVVCGSVYLALARPAADQVPLFPYTSDGPWRGSVLLWTIVGLASVGGAGAVLLRRDARRI